MEHTPTPHRRLNVLVKAARRKRIFVRLREGWAYDEIAGEERVSAERIRQIVADVLDKRVIDRGRRPRASAARTPHARHADHRRATAELEDDRGRAGLRNFRR
jgi:hypothetical protein